MIRRSDLADAFDEPLILAHLEELKAGRGVDQPVYDYAVHERTDETQRLEATPVVIVEGILTLSLSAIRPLLDMKLFVDTPADIRFIRRLNRDIAERGRTMESVFEQYLSTVRPMHNAFIEPARRHADLIVPEGGQNEIALDVVRSFIETLLV